MVMAIDALAMLNNIWTTRSFLVECQKYCTRTAEQPVTSTSGSVSDTMPMSTKKKQTEMVPVMPGRCSFRPEASTAIVKNTRKLARSAGCQRNRVRPSCRLPARITKLMKTLAAADSPLLAEVGASSLAIRRGTPPNHIAAPHHVRAPIRAAAPDDVASPDNVAAAHERIAAPNDIAAPNNVVAPDFIACDQGGSLRPWGIQKARRCRAPLCHVGAQEGGIDVQIAGADRKHVVSA